MNDCRPLILVTNDDGILSPGLTALCQALRPLGELLICAPNCQQTSMGRSYPRVSDGGIIEKVTLRPCGNSLAAYSIVGSPAACVAHGVLELADRLPSLCVSGINYGENLGKTLTYSGTFGAALQAADFGIPALAVSRPVPMEQIHASAYAALDWSSAQKAAVRWASLVLQEGMPCGSAILNINLPEEPIGAESFRLTTLSRMDLYAYTKPVPRLHTFPYTLQASKRTNFYQAEPGSDIDAVWREHVTSVTPLTGNFETAKISEY